MKILDRYVIATFLKNYLIAFFVLIGLYITLDMVFNFDELVQVQERSATPATGLDSALLVIRAAADYYFYQIFYIFVQLSGMIPVVAAAFTLIRLSRFNELSAMLSAGVPLLRIASPIIIVSLVLNGLLLLDQELLIPEIIPKLVRTRQDAGQQTVTKFYTIPAMQDDRNAVLNVARYHPGPGNPVMIELTLVERNREFRVKSEAEVRALKAKEWDVALCADNQRTYQFIARPTTPTAAPATAGAATTAPAPPSILEPDAADAGAVDAGGAPLAWVEVKPGSVTGDSPVAKQTASRGEWDPATRSWRLTGGTRVDGLLFNEHRSINHEVATYRSNITPEEINLYRSGNYVELLATRRIDELLARPQSYGTLALLRVKHARFTQPLVNMILLLLAIPTVLSREPTRLKQAATRCLILTAICLASSFLGQQLAGQPPSGSLAPHWPALMAWAPILLFGPVAVFLLDRVET